MIGFAAGESERDGVGAGLQATGLGVVQHGSGYGAAVGGLNSHVSGATTSLARQANTNQALAVGEDDMAGHVVPGITLVGDRDTRVHEGLIEVTYYVKANHKNRNFRRTSTVIWG